MRSQLQQWLDCLPFLMPFASVFCNFGNVPGPVNSVRAPVHLDSLRRQRAREEAREHRGHEGMRRNHRWPQDELPPKRWSSKTACSTPTMVEPHALLDALQALEKSHQRVRIQHWGPRTLDLDLLLYGAQTIDTERLSVPHPWLGKRSFVLHPLAEIAPDLTLPSGESIESLLPLCDAGDLNVITAS